MSFELDLLSAVRSIRDGFRGSAEIPIPFGSCTRADTGAPLAVFADGASAVPGLSFEGSESAAIRWNNHATPTAVATNVFLPSDFDPAYPAMLNFVVSKTGTTAGDATSVTTTAFVFKSGQLYDADANCGGATGAVVPGAAAKTTTTLTRALSAADLTASLGTTGPGVLGLTFGPTAGTLGTDDFVIHSAYLTYTRKAPAA